MPTDYYRIYHPLSERICHFCGKSFVPIKSNSEVLCSFRCKIDSVNHRQWKNSPVVCAGCGKEFFKKHASQKFCSEGCRAVNKPKMIIKEAKTVLPKLIFSKSCLFCGNDFETTKEKAKHCSLRCSRATANKKRGNRIKSELVKKPCEVCGFSDLRAIHRHHLNIDQGNAGGVICLCANHHCIYHAIIGWNGNSEHKTREEVIAILSQAENGKNVP